MGRSCQDGVEPLAGQTGEAKKTRKMETVTTNSFKTARRRKAWKTEGVEVVGEESADKADMKVRSELGYYISHREWTGHDLEMHRNKGATEVSDIQRPTVV